MTMIRIICLIAVWAFAVPRLGAAEVSEEVLRAEQARVDAIDRMKDSVVAIFASGGGGGGSGVCISPDGFTLTNFHVVQPCGPAMKCGMADGRVYDAVIVGVDPTGDIALIKMFGRDDFPCARLADSDTVRVGDEAYVLGNPFLLANTLYPTVTWGIISAVHRYQYPAGTFLEYTDCIQTDASVNPGNSGGPLFNSSGDVIGINGRCSFEKRGRVNVGVGWAVSSNQVKNFLGYLYSGRVVDHATAGFTVASDENQRVVVEDILESSDAYRRGLRRDDEIISFAGRPIDSVNTFKNVLGIYPNRWRVSLSFRHGGERRDVLIRLRGLHTKDEMHQAVQMGRPRPIPVEPRRDEGPEDESQQSDGEGQTPRKAPRGPGAPPIRLASIAPVVPEAIRPYYDARPGFANYYFNRLHRDRVLDRWKASLAELGTESWTLAGPIEGGGTFRFEIDDASVTFDLPAEQGVWQATDQIDQRLEPLGSGGLFASLYLWRSLAVSSPEELGDVFYQGTAPWRGSAEPADVVVATTRGVDCWFYFDVNNGRLLAIEMISDEADDPCEVEFLGDAALEHVPLPGRLRVRCGDLHFATFHVE